jgi:hypothetical protein
MNVAEIYVWGVRGRTGFVISMAFLAMRIQEPEMLAMTCVESKPILCFISAEY